MLYYLKQQKSLSDNLGYSQMVKASVFDTVIKGSNPFILKNLLLKKSNSIFT